MDPNLKAKKKNFFKRKRVIIPFILVILFIGGSILFKRGDNSKNITTDFAKIIDLKETIPVTGQVSSNTDLNLSFNSSGIVKSIKVKVGDKVKAGDVLAALNQRTALADLTSARGSLAAAKAKLKKVLEGGEVTLAKIALDSAKTNYENTKRQQQTLVKNAYNNLLNSTLIATPGDGVSDNNTCPDISGTYNLGVEGQIWINLYYTGEGLSFSASGLTSGSGIINSNISQPIGDTGLYIKDSGSGTFAISKCVIEIPNKKASNYLTNYNAYQSALKAQESALASSKALVDQRQAEYEIKVSSANGSDVDLAQAEVLSAQGKVEQALANYNNTQIIAPADGTITRIDVKIGELTQALNPVVVLQDISNMYLEANVNEANISRVKIGAVVEVTFDAFGSDKKYTGIITKIDPSSTLISGVVNYKITATVDQVEELKPGMTANMVILINEREQVVTVPSRAILFDESGNKIIRLITNTKRKKFESIPISTGIEGDGGLVEITNGISPGDEFVILIKTK